MTDEYKTSYKTIYSDVQFMMKFDRCSLNLLARLLTHCSTHWQAEWSNCPDIVVKDSVSTNSMLFREGTLPASIATSGVASTTHYDIVICVVNMQLVAICMTLQMGMHI